VNSAATTWEIGEGASVLRPFEIHQPATTAEASRLSARYGDEAAFYAGGTELLLAMKEGLLRYRHLIDLKTIPGLCGIECDSAGNALCVGALATHRTIERSPAVAEHLPLLAEVERGVANIRVKHMGTIGGNLCFAEPRADPGTLCAACDATVRLDGASGTRQMTIEEFFVGPYETSRAPDEVLTEIRLPRFGPRTQGAYMKFGVHERPTLGVAVVLTLSADGAVVADARVAVGCVNPRPTRLREAEDAARGRSVADLLRTVDEVAAASELALTPVSDVHGSAEYKTAMTKVFVRRALRTACGRVERGEA